MLLAYMLWFFACGVGAHRFYLGAYQSAAILLGLWLFGLLSLAAEGIVIGLILLGFWALWCIADAFLIPGLHRKANARAIGNGFNARAVFG